MLFIQITRYRAAVGGREMATYIPLFDRIEAGRTRPWGERLTWDLVDAEGGKVTVVRLYVELERLSMACDTPCWLSPAALQPGL